MYPADMTDPPFPVETESPKEPKTSASRRLAFAAWNRLKGEGDPAAEDLPAETQKRLELFAREIRNGTIEQLAGAVKRFYDKQNGVASESLLSLKE